MTDDRAERFGRIADHTRKRIKELQDYLGWAGSHLTIREFFQRKLDEEKKALADLTKLAEGDHSMYHTNKCTFEKLADCDQHRARCVARVKEE